MSGRRPEGGRDRTIAAVLDALAHGLQTNWLLVYDNAAQPLELQPYLPACPPNGHIIITSRLQNWPGYIEKDNVGVSPFTKDEAVSFLRRRVALLGADPGLGRRGRTPYQRGGTPGRGAGTSAHRGRARRRLPDRDRS